MKTNQLIICWLFVLIGFICSCKKAEPSSVKPEDKPNEPTEVSEGTTKTFKIDSIRHVIKQDQTIKIVSDSVWKDSLGITFKVKNKEVNYTFSMIESNANDVFIGALLEKQSLLKNAEWLSVKGYKPEKNVLVYLENNGGYDYWMDNIAPTQTGTWSFIKKAREQKKSDGQSLELTAVGTEFHDYDYI
ncbi:hypothetical protein GCM10023231_06660 [Olivibacter ginsenosidimutans]|uniref:Uncharacterized protein n=1 Tax=Olivibacter ginsenosidimutans TaxID=1176537 RepID=A0ABP9AIG3_9SPHI